MNRKSPAEPRSHKSREATAGASIKPTASSSGLNKSHLDNKMTIHVENLGPIDQADFVPAPLTIIAGPNSSGKSYLATSFYGFLSIKRDEEFSLSLTKSERAANHPLFTNKEKSELVGSGSTHMKLSLEEFAAAAKDFFDFLSEAYSSKLGRIFNLNTDNLDNATFSFTPSVSLMKRCYGFLMDSFKPMHLGNVVISMGSDGAAGEPCLSIEMHSKHKKVSDDNTILSILAISLDFLLFSTMLYRTHIFTSDRPGIALFYKELDHQKNSLLQKLQRSEFSSGNTLSDELSRYPLPTHDNINYARDIYRSVMNHSFLAPDPDKKYYRLIEEMLGGSFYIENDEIKLKSLPGNSREFDIPFHTASAAARELALFYFYLKHDAMKADVVFIDEPEAHLDPQNLIRLAWLISNCVNAEINIFVTTHSEMLLKELNNLFMLGSGKLNREKFFSLHPEYEKLTPLKTGQIIAYTCDNHTLTPCEMNSRGMVIPTIDDAIVTLASVSTALDSFIPE